ncbi:MAG: CBS domain-containing protein [Aridibacter sp.]
MKVNKIMTKTVGFCQAEDDLAKAVEIMREKDCGFVPVVNKKSEVIGIVTDRDIAIAVFMQKKTASKISIGDIIDRRIITCSEKDDVEDVLKKMRKHQVKRLPVIDKKEKLSGIISITDILLAARKDKSLKKKIFKTLEAIGKPRPIVLKAV